MRTCNLKDLKLHGGAEERPSSMRWKNPYQVVAMERAEPYVCDPVSFPAIERMTASST